MRYELIQNVQNRIIISSVPRAAKNVRIGFTMMCDIFFCVFVCKKPFLQGIVCKVIA